MSAEEKGEKYSRKTHLYALPDLNLGFSNITYQGCGVGEQYYLLHGFFTFFLEYLSYASAGGLQLQGLNRRAEGKDEGLYREELQ